MSNKIKIAVLMGGKSSEHDISLISGKTVVKKLDKKKFEVYPVIISKNNNKFDIPKDIDLVFIALHGPFGEDGKVQTKLEKAGISYTGSGVEASMLGMDKLKFRQVMSREDIEVPKYIFVKKGKNYREDIKDLGKPPYFVKPNSQGSSRGCSIVNNTKSLRSALNRAYKYEELALIDKYIKGKEITCGVLGNNNPLALPLVEIVPKNKFFDYKAKYFDKNTLEIVPARIGKNIAKKIQTLAINVHQIIGCRGFSRVDFIVDKRNVYVLEINTIPGLTPMSLLPKAAKAAGISYKELLNKIIRYSLE